MGARRGEVAVTAVRAVVNPGSDRSMNPAVRDGSTGEIVSSEGDAGRSRTASVRTPESGGSMSNLR